MANQTILGLSQIAPQASFGTAASTGFLTLESLPVFPNVQRETFDRNTLRGAHYTPRPLEGKLSNLEFSVAVQALHGVDSSIPTDVPDPTAETLLFKSLLGAQDSPSGYAASAVVSSGSTSSSVKIDNGTSSSLFKPGTAVIFSNGSSPATYAMGWIQAVTDGGGSDHTLTLLQALPFTPGNGTTVWATVTCYSSTSTAPQLLTGRFQSSESTSRMEVWDACVKAAKISADPAGEIGCEFTLLQGNIVASSAALTDYAYDLPTIPSLMGANGARFMLGGSAVAVNSLAVNIMADPQPKGDHNGDQGIGGWLVASRSIEVEVTRYVEGAAPIYSLPAVSSIVIQFGTTPGNMIGICIPVVDIDKPGQIQDQNGFWVQTFKYRANRYAGDTGSGAANSAWRVAVG